VLLPLGDVCALLEAELAVPTAAVVVNSAPLLFRSGVLPASSRERRAQEFAALPTDVSAMEMSGSMRATLSMSARAASSVLRRATAAAASRSTCANRSPNKLSHDFTPWSIDSSNIAVNGKSAERCVDQAASAPP
jgi:hypothetical protein